MTRLGYFVKKELLLLGRDPHGLLLLFAMPALFILIMSFALQNQYAIRGTASLEYYLINEDGGKASRDLVAKLEADPTFEHLESADGNGSETDEYLRQLVSEDKAIFLLLIHEDYEDRLAHDEIAVTLEIAPSTSPLVVQLVKSRLWKLLGDAYLQVVLPPLLSEAGVVEADAAVSSIDVDIEALLASRSLYRGDETQKTPSSVQQNVPAWLLFAMFFIAIPLSTTLIHERQQGTLARLQTMAFPRYQLFLGKLIPFFFINLIQVAAMLLVGVYLIPALGGEQLVIGSGYPALMVVAVAASLAAVSYALLIAQVVRTTEQATIFTGVSNIIMAAVGGVMVPHFLMPPLMQELSVVSPMAWGLEGFLDVLLRSGDVSDVLPEAGALVAFAAALLGLSVVISQKRPER